ncbi:MAG TPA: manganese efflux pump [Alphaproteobacteria bacterium]|nr:manganese efflux pump [Alphaproteobacteria bacterium]
MSVGLGMRGVTPQERLRIAIAFPCAEILMNCLGAALGALTGRLIGDAAGYVGFAALIAVGCYMILEARSAMAERRPAKVPSGWGLLVASLAISLDSLGIGFSILFVGVPVAASLIVIGIVSVIATLLGLRLGRILGSRVEDLSEMLAGVLLAFTGVAFIALKVLHAG